MQVLEVALGHLVPWCIPSMHEFETPVFGFVDSAQQRISMPWGAFRRSMLHPYGPNPGLIYGTNLRIWV